MSRLKVSKYAAVNAKIQAMESLLLSDEDYKELISKNSVSEIVSYLKENTAYTVMFKDVNPESTHRRELETLIKKKTVSVFSKFINFFYGSDKEFVLLLLRQLEIENLKLSIRNALTEARKSANELSGKFYELGSHASIDPAKIAACSNSDEVLEALEGSPYSEVIRNVLESQAKSKESIVYFVESALDRWYFMSLKRKSTKFNERVIMQDVGTRVDLSNIEWIVRAKEFYTLSPEELYNSLIPMQYMAKLDYLRMACDTKSAAEAIEFFNRGPYSKIFENLTDDDILSFNLTQRLRRYFYNSVKIKRSSHNFTLAKVLEYLYMMDYEFSDIILIIEAVRYSMEREEISQHLIRPLGR